MVESSGRAYFLRGHEGVGGEEQQGDEAETGGFGGQLGSSAEQSRGKPIVRAAAVVWSCT